MIYSIPEKFAFRLHHVRPRFKGQVESVLIYIATELMKIGEKPRDQFMKMADDAIRAFPGNAKLTQKAIDNWRTEISALFGFIEEDSAAGLMRPSRRAVELAEKQDLVRSFKIFNYFFQYPGLHIKPHRVIAQIVAGIHFKPAHYILNLLKHAEMKTGNRIGISAAELTHCVFNDLRVTRDQEGVVVTWGRINGNREAGVEYDWSGDVIRYAGDILDYMVIANLLEKHGRNYFLNPLEKPTIESFVKKEPWCNVFDKYLESRVAPVAEIAGLKEAWLNHVNQEIDGVFATDTLAFVSADVTQYNKLLGTYKRIMEDHYGGDQAFETTKQIGDIGENMVLGHECQRIKESGRPDLVHLVKWIPTTLGMGYDIKSVEVDETQRLIEVKTTISSSELDFTKFHLTPNEWKAAESYGQRYWVYRLMLSKHRIRLFVLRDPVGQYKSDKLQMVPRDGADISFNPAVTGSFDELLTWQE